MATLPPHALPSIAPSLYPLLLRAILSSTSASPPLSPLPPPWTVTPRPHKGSGALSTRSLSLGELILQERPLLIWPPSIDAEEAKVLFEAMEETHKRVFMDLARTESEDPEVNGLDEVRARRATNGFAVEIPPDEEEEEDGNGEDREKKVNTVSMVFPKLARLNHSCLPNATQAMNFRDLRMEIYTLTSIPVCTELQIEYLPLITCPHSVRQSRLLASFGFPTCLCALCTSSPAEIEASDKRRLELKGLAEGLHASRGDRALTLRKLERMEELLELEGYAGLPEFGELLKGMELDAGFTDFLAVLNWMRWRMEEDSSISDTYAAYAAMRARRKAALAAEEEGERMAA